MKKKVTTILIIIIFLAGLSLLLYPLVANQWNNHRQKQLISGYEEVIAKKEKMEKLIMSRSGKMPMRIMILFSHPFFRILLQLQRLPMKKILIIFLV